MKSRTNHLLGAVVLGMIVAFLNWSYLSSRVSELTPKKMEKLVRVKKSISPGGQLQKANIESVLIPEQYAPKAAVRFEDVAQLFGQEVTVEVPAGDYLLRNYFDKHDRAGADKLSGLIAGDNMRAVSLPIDDTTSLGRSIAKGDRVDIVFTFSVPFAQQKMSTVLLQNVEVLMTGSYSAAEQEIGERGGSAKPYNILTLLLPYSDAVRLNYARSAGQLSLMLRSAKDTALQQPEPILNVADILSAADRDRVEMLRRKSMEELAPQADKLREQLKEVFEKQRQQMPTERR